MGVFGDNFRKYYEIGLSCVPIKPDTKRPLLNNWQKYCDELPTQDEVNEWESRFSNDNKIGLCLGKASGVVAFDYDYEFDESKVKIERKDFEKDQRMVEKMILSMLPPTHCVKKGKKGWTRFYKWTPALDASSNLSCDRNGIRLFDFLSWHKQTIIPPSIHSIDNETGQAIFYKWTGIPIDQCLDELPEIDLAIVEDIRAIFLGKKNKDEVPTRHDVLLSYILLCLKLTKSIEKTVPLVVERDLIINKEKPYLIDAKHHSSLDAFVNAKKWVTRVSAWANEKTANTEVKKMIGDDQGTYFEFFKQKLPEHAVELLSNNFLMNLKTVDAFNNTNEKWTPVENNIGALRSDAIEVGLAKSHVEDHLMKYKTTLKPRFLFDLKKWDGVDRIDLICRAVPATNYVNSENKDERENQHNAYVSMIKHTAAGIFRRAHNSEEQNLANIIRGEQGKGKNTWLVNVFGKPFTKYYWSEINICNDQQKNYDAVDGRLVCIIGEFDQTSKVQISFLKELITNSGYSSRRAYDRRSDRYELHHTIFSASNFDSVLKDTTGNRRFNIFDFPNIDWSYNKYLDFDQLRYQYYSLYEDGYEMTDDAKSMVSEFIKSENPDDPLDLAVELYKQHIIDRTNHSIFSDRFNRLSPNSDLWTNVDVTPSINEASRMAGVSEKWLRHRLKKVGLAKRQMNGMVFHNFIKN